MLAFITVGSTRFDDLIAAVFQTRVLSAFKKKGYHNVVVQCGNSLFEYSDEIKDGGTKVKSENGIKIEYWKFKPSLEEDFEKADLIISHAGEKEMCFTRVRSTNLSQGSGTILDVLRKGKLMIVIPNHTLLDNHQTELAEALQSMEHLKAATIELVKSYARGK